MKKIALIIFLAFSNQAFAADNTFFLKPSVSIEYVAPKIVKSGVNSEFRTSGNLFHQIGDISNFAIGGNLRVHKYLGFNANWVQIDLKNSQLQGAGSLSDRAQLGFDQYNLSTLVYYPVVKDLFELFVEGGASDVRSRLTYSENGNHVDQRKHQTVGFYGVGFQVNASDKDLIRFAWHRYAGRKAFIESEYSDIRIGYLRSF